MAQLQNLHALPIIVSAIAAWFFGAVYYGILGPKWMAAQGKTIEQCKAEHAGKSTAVKILTTLSKPDGGSARVAGHDVLRRPDRVRRAIGCVAQKSGVDRDATGRFE